MSSNFMLIFLLEVISLIQGLPTGTSIRTPIASGQIKGWITITENQEGLVLTFELKSEIKEPLINWSLVETPLIMGEDKCWSIAKNKEIFAGQKPLTVKSGLINETATVKNKTLANVDVGAFLIKTPNGEMISCGNVLSKNVTILQSKYYGPELAGNLFFFVNVETKQMKIYSRIINANNFDVNVKWSLKKFWWLAEQDANEPGSLSCREKASSAYVWLNPSAPDNLLKPETPAIITIKQFNMTLKDLDNAVFVLEKIDAKSWEKPTLACSRINVVSSVQSISCSGEPPVAYNWNQQSPFHPVLVDKTNTTSPCDSLPHITTLTTENKLQQSDGTDLAFNIDLPQSYKFNKPNEQLVAVAHFVFPIVGSIYFIQSSKNPDSSTTVFGSLQSLYDMEPLKNSSLSFMKSWTTSGLDAMTCSKYKELYNPTGVDPVLCQKSLQTCPIGSVPHTFTVGEYNSTDGSKHHQFIFVSQKLPLQGPFSIVGQTVQVTIPWGQACANVTLTTADIQNATGCDVSLHSDSDIANIDRKAVTVVGTFDKPEDIILGNIYLVQYPNFPITRLQTQDAGFYIFPSNNISNFNDLAWDIIEINENQTCKSAQAYNPFGVDVAATSYVKACHANSLLCALGDLRSKLPDGKFAEKNCLNSVPISGDFSAVGKTIRVRLLATPNRVSCTSLKIIESSSLLVFADNKLSNSEIKQTISSDSSVFKSTLKIEQEKTDRKISKQCSAYRISIFGPNAAQISVLLNEKFQNDTVLSKTLHYNECVSGISDFRSSSIVTILMGVFMEVYLLYVFH